MSRHKGGKSLTAQYVDRRLKGQSPEEARKRSYLGRTGAWRAEQKYAVAKKQAEEAQKLLNDREKAEFAALQRAKDEAARDLAERQARLKAAKLNLRPPTGHTKETCKNCWCALCHPATPAPISDFDQRFPDIKLPPKPAIPALTISDMIIGRTFKPEVIDESRSMETFVHKMPDGTSKTFSCRDPKAEFFTDNPLFQLWERRRAAEAAGEIGASNPFQPGTWTQESGFVAADPDRKPKDNISGVWTLETGHVTHDQAAREARNARDERWCDVSDPYVAKYRRKAMGLPDPNAWSDADVKNMNPPPEDEWL